MYRDTFVPPELRAGGSNSLGFVAAPTNPETYVYFAVASWYQQTSFPGPGADQTPVFWNVADGLFQYP